MISDTQFDFNRSICGDLVNKYDMMLGDSRPVESDDAQSSLLLLPAASLAFGADEQELLPVGEEKKEVKTTIAPLFMKKKHQKKKPYRQMRQAALETSWRHPGRGPPPCKNNDHDDDHHHHYDHDRTGLPPHDTSTTKRNSRSMRQSEDPQTCFADSIFWNSRKSVTFPAEKGLERYQEAPECNSTFCVADLWYLPEDFARFRFLAQLEASAICLTDESSNQCLYFLEQSISIAARLAKEVCKYQKRGHNEAALWDRIFERVDIRQTGITDWSLHSSYRGLEYLASKPLRRAKYSTRKHMVRELNRQEQYYHHHRHMALETRKRRSLSPQELAAKLEQQSQFSRLFARMLGMADELSVRQEYENQ